MGLTGGYTKIEYCGQRKPDGAKMGMIELLGNPLADWELKKDMQDANELGRDTFWQWEQKIIKQEQQYFKDQLDELQEKIDSEVD